MNQTPRRAPRMQLTEQTRGNGMPSIRTIAGIGIVVGLLVVGVVWSRNAGDGNSLEAQVAKIVPRIEAATGLAFRTPPVVDTRSREEVREFLLAQLDDSSAARELDGQELAMKRFGLIGENLSLRRLYLDVLEEQIAGYYDPKSKVLYVVDGTSPEMREVTIAHELIHSLQDQHLNLDSIQSMRGRDDRQIAAHSVVEGQATLEQLQLMAGVDLNAALPGGWEGVRAVIEQEQTRMPKFSAAPAAIQELLLFPYLSGADFVRRFKINRPGENILDNLPVSTEQILHTSAFFGTDGSPQDLPTEVILPPLRGVTPLYENTLGEFGVRLLIHEHRKNIQDANSGAMGWDGDRYIVFRSGESTGLIWISVWDNGIEGAEFLDIFARHFRLSFAAASSRAVPAASRPGTVSGTEYRAEGRVYFLGGAEIQGRPAVVYIDVPDGSSWNVMDLARITLSESR